MSSIAKVATIVAFAGIVAACSRAEPEPAPQPMPIIQPEPVFTGKV